MVTLNPKATVTEELPDGAKVTLRKYISYKEFEEIYNNEKVAHSERSFLLLKKIVTAWDYCNEDGSPYALTDESLRDLPVSIQLEITKIANDLYGPTKKKSPPLDQSSSQETQKSGDTGTPSLTGNSQSSSD